MTKKNNINFDKCENNIKLNSNTSEYSRFLLKCNGISYHHINETNSNKDKYKTIRNFSNTKTPLNRCDDKVLNDCVEKIKLFDARDLGIQEHKNIFENSCKWHKYPNSTTRCNDDFIIFDNGDIYVIECKSTKPLSCHPFTQVLNGKKKIEEYINQNLDSNKFKNFYYCIAKIKVTISSDNRGETGEIDILDMSTREEKETKVIPATQEIHYCNNHKVIIWYSYVDDESLNSFIIDPQEIKQLANNHIC